MLTAAVVDTAEKGDSRRTGEPAAGSPGVGCGSLVLDSKTSQS
jgi:hypothetical protein